MGLLYSTDQRDAMQDLTPPPCPPAPPGWNDERCEACITLGCTICPHNRPALPNWLPMAREGINIPMATQATPFNADFEGELNETNRRNRSNVDTIQENERLKCIRDLKKQLSSVASIQSNNNTRRDLINIRLSIMARIADLESLQTIPLTRQIAVQPTLNDFKTKFRTPHCGICTCDIKEGEDIRVLKCGHMYHTNCFKLEKCIYKCE